MINVAFNEDIKIYESTNTVKSSLLFDHAESLSIKTTKLAYLNKQGVFNGSTFYMST